MKLKTTLVLLVLAFTLTQCKKDITSGIIGKYTNGQTGNDRVDIVVNKVDESTVSITVEDNYGTHSFASTKMNSATSFTLNSYSDKDGGYDYTYSGSGTYSAGNISVTIKTERVDDFTGTKDDYTNTYIGSK